MFSGVGERWKTAQCFMLQIMRYDWHKKQGGGDDVQDDSNHAKLAIAAEVDIYASGRICVEADAAIRHNY